MPREMDRHHRLPRSRGGSNRPENISIVERKLHVAWHKIVGNMNAPEVARMLSDTWIDAAYYFVAVPRKRKHPKHRRRRRYCLDCNREVMKNLAPTKKEEPP